MTNPKRHSYSRISTFAEICERQHALDALKGQWRESLASRKGQQVHDAFERAAALKRGGRSADVAVSIVKGEAIPKGAPLDAKGLAGYLDRFEPILGALTPLAEEQWFRSLPNVAPIVGKIDLVSGSMPQFDEYGRFTGEKEPVRCVVDYKTTSNPRAMKSFEEARKSLQLQIYCLADGCRTAGFLYFLPSGDPRGVFVTFEDSELAHARRWLRDTIEVIDNRWKQAAAEGSDAESPVLDKDGKPYDVTPFALAKMGHPLCTAKHCDFYDECLGRKDED